MKQNLFTFFILLSFGLFAQTGAKSFFDKSGKTTSETNAYYYRESVGGNSYKSYYVHGGMIYFEGKISSASSSDESANVYASTCKWYYKNGKLKTVKSFNESGNEEGLSVYYFENGKIWKEVNNKNGVPENQYTEYDEQGQRSLIFQDDFNNNRNDWDLYTSDKSTSSITGGKLNIVSNTSAGTSRYISVSASESPFFTIEANVNIANLKEGDKGGLIFGFKDWNNYNFFFISNSSFYIGTMYEGVQSFNSEGMYSSAIKKGESNILKVLAGEQNIYSINGEIQFSTDQLLRNYGSNIGFGVSGKSSLLVDEFIYKQINFQGNGTASSTSNEDRDVKATGSGLVLSLTGYIVTNHHVIEDAKTITVELIENGTPKSYNAIVVQKDAANDLAIIKIEDKNFTSIKDALKYSVKDNGGVEVGASVFTIGYPFALGGMGKEAKYTDGKVSAKTGYNGSINAYQTSIPVQPGNSGGPVFNEKGQLVGIINATVKNTDNVSYAIKLNYIKTLIEVLPDAVTLPNFNNDGLTNEQKIKNLSPSVVLIKIK